MQAPNATIASLHATYERESGERLRLNGIYYREQAWLIWVQQGFTEADLTLVIRYLKEMIRKDRRRPESLKFSNLVESWDRFEEDLSLARGWSRNRPPAKSARQDALRAIGRSEPEPDRVKTAGQALGRLVNKEDWDKWHKEEGL